MPKKIFIDGVDLEYQHDSGECHVPLIEFGTAQFRVTQYGSGQSTVLLFVLYGIRLLCAEPENDAIYDFRFINLDAILSELKLVADKKIERRQLPPTLKYRRVMMEARNINTTEIYDLLESPIYFDF